MNKIELYKDGKKATYVRLENDLEGLWLNKKGGHPITQDEVDELIKDADEVKRITTNRVVEYKFQNDSYIRIGPAWYNTKKPYLFLPYNEVMKEIKKRNGEKYTTRKESDLC